MEVTINGVTAKLLPPERGFWDRVVARGVEIGTVVVGTNGVDGVWLASFSVPFSDLGAREFRSERAAVEYILRGHLTLRANGY